MTEEDFVEEFNGLPVDEETLIDSILATVDRGFSLHSFAYEAQKSLEELYGYLYKLGYEFG